MSRLHHLLRFVAAVLAGMLAIAGTGGAHAALVLPDYSGVTSVAAPASTQLPAGLAQGISLPGIEGIPSISVGSQPVPPSSYTTIQEPAPGQPTVIIIGGTDDQDSSQQLERLRSSLPHGVGIKTITSPQTVGAGWDGILVVGTGGYTYQKSIDAGVAATKAAILASDGNAPVSIVGYSQGATIAHVATQQLAAAGMLPAGTTVATFGDPNTPNTGLAYWAPAFTPGMPSSPFDVTNAAAPTTITNINQDTWAANVSSNPLVALFYAAPGAIIHGKAYSAEEMERWADTGTVTQIGDNTTLVVLHPKTAGGNDINPWFYAYDLLAREYGLPQLKGPAYEMLNQALNLAVPLGESGQPTKVGGVTIPTLNELTQPFAGSQTTSPTSDATVSRSDEDSSTPTVTSSPAEPPSETPSIPLVAQSELPVSLPVESTEEIPSSTDTTSQPVDDDTVVTQVVPEPSDSSDGGTAAGGTSTSSLEESDGSETTTESSSGISESTTTDADAPSGETESVVGDSGTADSGGAGSDE